jgi:hypothetical protein
MNEIREIRQALEDIRYERIVVRAELAFRNFVRAFKAGYNELQPRDERGAGPPKAESK